MIRIEVFLRYACDLLFGEGLDLLVSREDVIYGFRVCERIYEDVHLGRRRLIETLVALRVHVFYVRNQFIGYLAAFDLVDLLHDDSLGSLVRLIHLLVGIIVRNSHYEHASVITAGIREGICLSYVTFGVHLVQQTGLAVIEEVAYELQYILVRITFLHSLVNPRYLRSVTQVVVFLAC